MSDLTRRGFVKNSAATRSWDDRRSERSSPSRPMPSRARVGSEPVVAYVRDPAKGEISVMSGDREVTVHDRSSPPRSPAPCAERRRGPTAAPVSQTP